MLISLYILFCSKIPEIKQLFEIDFGPASSLLIQFFRKALKLKRFLFLFQRSKSAIIGKISG